MSTIQHNTIMKPDVPEIRNAAYAEGATIIRHREYLGPIITSATAGDFKIESFALNPAQSTTFPWLSQLAQNYEEYKPNGLLFEFRSTASDAIASSTNLALGQVMLCTQYDPTDPEFDTDIELLNYSWAQSGKVSDNLMHFVECDPKQSPMSHLYTRTGSNASSSDLRFSDFGRFSIATSGLQGTSVQVGQLWVSYEFLLYKPKVGASQSTGGGQFIYTQTASGTVSKNVLLGDLDQGQLWEDNNINVLLSYPTVNTCKLQFPLEEVDVTYDVNLVLDGDSTANVVATAGFTRGTNTKGIHIYDGNTYNVVMPNQAATSSLYSMRFCLHVPASENNTENYIIISAGATTIPANSTVRLIVTQMKNVDLTDFGYS